MDKTTRRAPQMGGSRLIIQKMVLENFKSYGGVREVRSSARTNVGEPASETPSRADRALPQAVLGHRGAQRERQVERD